MCVGGLLTETCFNLEQQKNLSHHFNQPNPVYVVNIPRLIIASLLEWKQEIKKRASANNLSRLILNKVITEAAKERERKKLSSTNEIIMCCFFYKFVKAWNRKRNFQLKRHKNHLILFPMKLETENILHKTLFSALFGVMNTNWVIFFVVFSTAYRWMWFNTCRLINLHQVLLIIRFINIHRVKTLFLLLLSL